MNRVLLTKAECAALRGLAILAIVLHNYTHWLGLAVKENEYQFHRNNCDGLLHAVLHADINLPIHLLSFFGHYGVPVFLFLSGYGLVLKYEKSQRAPLSTAKAPSSAPEGATNVSSTENTAEKAMQAPSGAVGGAFFLRYHFLKLFRMMIVGFVAFVMLDAITPGRHHYQLLHVVAQLGMLNNLLPTPDKVIWPGPYWFFGLMLQLYIVYRLLIWRRHWGIVVGLIVVCWLLQAFCNPTGELLNRLRYNFVGGMLPFGLGVLLARFQSRFITTLSAGKGRYAMLLLTASALVFLLSFNYQTWYWVPVFVVLGSVALVKVLPRSIATMLEWTGGVSAAMFVCHPIARKIIIAPYRTTDIYAGLLLYLVACICLAWLFAEVMKRIPEPRKH